MKLLVLASLVALGAAHPGGYRDELDLSPSSLLQTARNVFTLPRFLGGGKHVDSDVRFGWTNSEDDSVGAVGNKRGFNSWDLQSVLSNFRSRSRDSEAPQPAFGVSQGIFDPPSGGAAETRDFKKRGPISSPLKLSGRESRRMKSVDDSPSDKVDSLGFFPGFGK